MRTPLPSPPARAPGPPNGHPWVALGTLVFIIAAAVLVSAFALGGVAFYPAFRRGVNAAFVVALLVAAAAGGRDWHRRRAARAPDPGTDAPAI